MNNRIKEIRNRNKISQEEFGKRIGITKASVSRIESGENNPSEQTVILICEKFGINQVWLRTGKGEMFLSVNEDERFAANVGKIQRTDDETIMRWVNAIAETNPSALKEIEGFMKRILGIEE